MQDVVPCPKKPWILFAVAMFVSAFLGGAIWFASLTSPMEENADANDPIDPVPALVANGLRDGSLACPDGDTLTFETCLLYQGALGVWQRLGFPEVCPNAGHLTADAYTAPIVHRPLTPEDTLAATTIPCFGHLYAIQVRMPFRC